MAVVAALAVVVAAGVTGFVLLGGDEDDSAKPDPTGSTSPASPTGSDRRGTDGGVKPTVPGWKTVVNPKQGLAFDVPPEWAPKSTDWVSWVSENDDPKDTPLVAVAAPAFLKERWCASDEDKDGVDEHAALGVVGTKGNKSARGTAEIARKDSATWIYGAYTQPDKDKVETGTVESFTTKSGLKGSLATSMSSGVEKEGKCTTEGKATVFGFKNSDGEFASWSFHGPRDVKDEVPDATIRKILATVREYETSADN